MGARASAGAGPAAIYLLRHPTLNAIEGQFDIGDFLT
jgi:hypothetical protein